MELSGDGRRTIARLADRLLPSLIDRLAHSQLGELEVREDGWRVRLRRSAPSPAEPEAAAEARKGRATRAVAQHPPNPGPGEPRAAPAPPEGAIISPGVGYFTPRSGLAKGGELRAGDVIGHVDVLGVGKEVVSPLAGVLRELEAEAGQAVEFGQRIGRIEPAR